MIVKMTGGWGKAMIVTDAGFMYCTRGRAREKVSESRGGYGKGFYWLDYILTNT